MILRHGGLPSSHCLQIAFEEKYSSKDGPSAAVACGLLVEAAITDMDIDPKLAVTGDMNADGQVQPIGGVAAKLRGATRSECSILAIPSKNESALADMMIRDGPGPLVGISVFSIEKFDDACELANPKRKEALQQALNEMEIIRSALKRDPSMMLTILRSPQAVTRLQEVLKKAPNCLSAKYLLLYATGTAPKYLTLAGSIEAADNDADILVSSINSDLNRAASQFQQDQVGGTLNRLRNLRPRVDQRVWPYVDGLVAYGEVLRSVILNPIKSASRAADVQRQAKGAAANVNSTRDKLLSDPAVREELGL
jgi:hypothetical protein